MRTAIAVLSCCVPLLAQFNNLVTNDDGSVLYFSSELRQRGSAQETHSKLFVLDSGGLRLFRQRPFEMAPPPYLTWPVSTYYSLESVALNGNGAVLGLISRRDCMGGSGCLSIPRYRSELQDGEINGRMQVSRNGRYALFGADGSMVPFNRLIDLQTGARKEWMSSSVTSLNYGRIRVSSGGTAVVLRNRELHVVTIESDRTIALPESPQDAVIDDQEQIVVYESASGLGLADLKTGALRALAPRAGSAAMSPSVSNDGKVAVFLSGEQMFVVSTERGTPREVVNEPSGIREFVLSGDGRVAFALTASGRLLRIAVESGTTEELIGQTPVLRMNLSGRAKPGSAMQIRGAGLAQGPASASPPLPREFNGVQLLLDGEPVPLQTVEPERIAFQIPWETGTGSHRLEIVTGANKYFETEAATLEVRDPVFAEFEILSPEHGTSLTLLPHALAAHGDFSALVTPGNPARPNEVIHFYMTGLGPVEPQVASGQPGPTDPPARVVAPIRCAFNDSEPAEVLFAGLAPGFAGYYQVTVRVPATVRAPNGEASVSCRSGGFETGEQRPLPVKP